MRLFGAIDLLGNLMFGQSYDNYSFFPPSPSLSVFAIDEVVCASGSATNTTNLSNGRAEITFANCAIDNIVVNGAVNAFIGSRNLTIVNSDLTLQVPNGSYSVTGHLEYFSEDSLEASIVVVDNTSAGPSTYWFDKFGIRADGGFYGNVYLDSIGRYTIDEANYGIANMNDVSFDIVVRNDISNGARVLGIAQQQATINLNGNEALANLSVPYEYSLNNRAPVLNIIAEPSVRRQENTLAIIAPSFDPDVQPLEFTIRAISGPSGGFSNVFTVPSFSFNLVFSQIGDYQIEVMATDPQGSSVSQIVSYSVFGRDAEVTLSSQVSVNGSAIQGSLKIDNQATDGPFMVSLVTAPKGTTLDIENLTFDWEPPFVNLGQSQVGNFSFGFESATVQSTASVEAELPAASTFVPRVLHLTPTADRHWINVNNKLFKIEAGTLFNVALVDNTFLFEPVNVKFDPLVMQTPGTPVHVTDLNNDSIIEIWFADALDNITVIDTQNNTVLRQFSDIDTNENFLRFKSLNLNNDDFTDVMVSDGLATRILFGPLLSNTLDIRRDYSLPQTQTTCDVNNDGINEIGYEFGLIDPLSNQQVFDSINGGLIYIHAAGSDKACELLVVDRDANGISTISVTDIRSNTTTLIAQLDDFQIGNESVFDFTYWAQNIDADEPAELLLSFTRSEGLDSSSVTVALDIYSDDIDAGPIAKNSDGNPVVLPLLDRGIQLTSAAEQVVTVALGENADNLHTAHTQQILINELQNDNTANKSRFEALAIKAVDDTLVLESIAQSSINSSIAIDLWLGDKAYGYDSENAELVVIDHSAATVTTERRAMAGKVRVLEQNGLPVYYQIEYGGNTVLRKYNYLFELVWEQIVPLQTAFSDNLNAINSGIIILSQAFQSIVAIRTDTGEILAEISAATFSADEANNPIVVEDAGKQYLLVNFLGEEPKWLVFDQDYQVSLQDDSRLAPFRDDFANNWQRMQLDDDPALELVQIFFYPSAQNGLRSIDESAINTNAQLVNEQVWPFSKQKSGLIQPCITGVAHCAEYAGAFTAGQDILSIHDRDTHLLKFRTTENMPPMTDLIIRVDPNNSNQYQMLLNSRGTWLLVE